MKYEVGDLLYSNDFTSWYESGLHTIVEVDSKDIHFPYRLQSPTGNKQWLSEASLEMCYTRLPKVAGNPKVTGEPMPAKTPSIQTKLMELLLDELELHTHKDFEITYVKDGKKVSVNVEEVDPKEIVDDLLIDGESVKTGMYNDGKAVMGIKIQNPFR